MYGVIGRLAMLAAAYELEATDPYAEASWTWINGRCRDNSKRRVQEIFAQIFGYPSAGRNREGSTPASSPPRQVRLHSFNAMYPTQALRLLLTCLVVALATLRAQGATGIVEGRVQNSANATFVAGARVTIDGTALETFTDADGRYTISKLPRGKTFVITAVKTGFAPRAYGELPPAGVPKLVTIRDGEQLLNLDIALAPENFITGVVLDVNGGLHIH